MWSTLPESLPPLRMLLVLDNLFGHYSVDFVLWLFAHGIMPLYTPLVGVGIWPNRFSGFSSAGMASIRRGRRRSSPGWRRQPVAGIGSPRRSSGAANARPDEHGLARAARVSVDEASGRGERSPDHGRPEPMAMSKSTDPHSFWTTAIVGLTWPYPRALRKTCLAITPHLSWLMQW